MTTNVFWRLAWKEYRQQRDLLIAIGLIAMALMMIALGWSWLENHELSTDTAYHIALMMPVFYVLGCAAMLFAGEHERDTFAFLRALPLRSREAFWPKSLVAIVSTLLLSALLVLMAALLTRFRPLKTPADFDLLLHYFLIMAEVLLWTMLFSQLLKHPFWAMAAGGFAYLASWMLMSFSVALVVHVLGLKPAGVDFTVYVVVRCAIAYLLALANIALGTTWLERDRVFATWLAGPTVEEIASVRGPATRWMMLSRLWWQSLRESGWIYLAIYIALTLLSVLIAIEKGSVFMVWGCLPVLAASFTFFQDHWKQQYRFFSEHGVGPRTLWWARILVSLAVCLPWFAMLIIAIITMKPEFTSGYERFRTFQWPADLLVLAVICFAWGQWCSLVFRSGVLGLFVGLAMSLGLPFALAILRFLGIPDWLGIYIPAAVLLWASWYRATDWLAERNSWRQWFAYAAMLAVPVLLYLTGIAAHRAYEIPQIVDNSSYVSGPGNVNIPAGIAAHHAAALAELQRPATSEELETARLYRELWTELRQLPPPNSGAGVMMESTPEGGFAPAGPAGAAEAGSSAMAAGPEVAAVDKEWEEKLAKLVGRFVEISRRPDAAFFREPFGEVKEDSEFLREFERAALADAKRLDEAGEYDQATERYLALIRLARHYQQRGGLLRVSYAVGSQSSVYEKLLSRAVRTQQSEESILKLRSTLQSAPYNFAPDYDVIWLRNYVWLRGLADLNPTAWELVSTGRNEFDTYRAILRYMPWEITRLRRWLDYQSAGISVSGSSTTIEQWKQNTVGSVSLGMWSAEDLRRMVEFPLNRQRAAVQLRLLLLAYRAKNGHLPQSLETLEQEYPGQVQPDPATGRAWGYRPNGVAGEERLQYPFIWAPAWWTLQNGAAPSDNVEDMAFRGEIFVIEPREEN